jgi:hypothetical protein
MENKIQLIERWKSISYDGDFKLAEEYYYVHLYPWISKRFATKYSTSRTQEVLISLLGYSPEPVLLVAAAYSPVSHLILTTTNILKDTEIKVRLNDNLDKSPTYEALDEESFHGVYSKLLEMLFRSPSRNITINITGGKKSMVAASSIFARDYGCQLVYVDQDEYLSDLRKPKPGTEKLVVVYHPTYLLGENEKSTP